MSNRRGFGKCNQESSPGKLLSTKLFTAYQNGTAKKNKKDDCGKAKKKRRSLEER